MLHSSDDMSQGCKTVSLSWSGVTLGPGCSQRLRAFSPPCPVRSSYRERNSIDERRNRRSWAWSGAFGAVSNRSLSAPSRVPACPKRVPKMTRARQLRANTEFTGSATAPLPGRKNTIDRDLLGSTATAACAGPRYR